ncbi:DeoR/GlpR family DNA-binding transcription regulator [Oscillospiraceae bacterium PP1C4]
MLHARRSQIVDEITEERMVKVSDLVQKYNVSIETIRRDLEYLEKNGYLKRVYGGAVLDRSYGQEPAYEHREVINYQEKQAIAAKTAELIDDGDTVFIDVGTTTLEVAHCLGMKKNLTVITNASLIAHSLLDNDTCRTILLGGEMRRGELSVSGFLCDANIKYFHANKAIIGVGGITIDNGITDYHIEEANSRRMMIDRVEKVIAVADYSKFGVTAMNSVCGINRIHSVVTDWSTPSKMVAEYRAAGLHVIVAPRLK